MNRFLSIMFLAAPIAFIFAIFASCMPWARNVALILLFVGIFSGAVAVTLTVIQVIRGDEMRFL